jgi:hypothetical protein
MDENTGFRRALKNPFVMGGLCISAGLAVYYNVMESTMISALPDSVDSAPLPLATAQDFSESSTPHMHDDMATRWIENPKRDPFAPISVARWSKPSSKQSSTSSTGIHEKGNEPLKQLELKAIALEAQERSAVINRSVVYEGEMIEGYQVVSIELQGVWLQRHGKKHLLAFATAQPLKSLF